MTDNKQTFKNLPSFNKAVSQTDENSPPLTMDRGILNEYFSPFSRIQSLTDSGLIQKAWKRFTK